MPRKKKILFTKIKRGRDGDGKGGCGHGRGGWQGRVSDVEVMGQTKLSNTDAHIQLKAIGDEETSKVLPLCP